MAVFPITLALIAIAGGDLARAQSFEVASIKPADPSAPLGTNRLARNVDMVWLARYLTHFGSDIPVIDKTGLIGNYDVDVDMQKVFEVASAEVHGGRPGSVTHFRLL